MINTLSALIVAIPTVYLLRWGYCLIVKRQRIDWALEREQLRQQLKLMYRIMQRLMRFYWRGRGSE